MFGGGESHAASVEQQQQSNDVSVKSHRSRCVLGRKDTEDSPLCVITPEESGWYRAYVNNFLLDEADSFKAKKFWNSFCMPYPSYKDLLHQINYDNRFEGWCGHKWNNKQSSSVELLLLGLLRYLGRGWTFDDIEEQTAISVSVHCNFSTNLLSLGALLFIQCMFSHRLILLRPTQTWQSTLRRDFLVVSGQGQVIVLTSQHRDVSTTLKTTISVARVVILPAHLI